MRGREGGWAEEGRNVIRKAKDRYSIKCRKGTSKHILDKQLFITLKICFRVCSADEGILNMLK